MLPEKQSAAKKKTPAASRINALFISEGSRMLSELENLIKNGNIIKGSKELRSYLINVHGLRSALFVMNRPDLSATATRLEKFSREENTDMIFAETPAFLEDLRAFIAKLTAADEESKKATVNIIENEEDKRFFVEKLQLIKSACENYDDLIIESTLEQLHAKECSQSTEHLLAYIANQLLFGDFQKISEAVQDFIEG